MFFQKNTTETEVAAAGKPAAAHLLFVGNQCGQGFSLTFGRLFKLAVFQERYDTVQQKPSVGVEYRLQFILFCLFRCPGTDFSTASA